MNGRVRVKICGMTRIDDAQCAAAAGVDALGFIFYAKSPRHIEPEAARRIIAGLPPLVDAVGVFVNEEMARVKAVVRGCGLQYAQLHGGESPDYCRELAARAGCRVLKAIRVGPATTAAEAAPYRGAVCGFLLDTYQQDAVGVVQNLLPAFTAAYSLYLDIRHHRSIGTSAVAKPASSPSEDDHSC